MQNSAGYQSLMTAVQKDCNEGCFNPEGCDKEGRTKCFHRYCNTFKWAIERAKHYSEKTGIPATEILDSWEKDRKYWYMNYYQDARQPLIKEGRVRVFDTLDQYMKSLEGKGFRCPKCGHESKDPFVCDAAPACDWKAYGLLGTLGQGITVFVKENLKMAEIFMPVAWEKAEAKQGPRP